MSVHETLPLAEIQKNDDAEIISFPHAELPETIEEPDHEIILFPTTAIFLNEIRKLDSDAKGSDVLMLLLEIMQQVPSASEIALLEQAIAEREALNTQLKLIETKDPTRQYVKAKLAKFEESLTVENLTRNDISDDTIMASKAYLQELKDKRAPEELRLKTLQQDYDAQYYTKGEKIPDFVDKSAELFEVTDEFVENDEMLELAQDVHKKARTNQRHTEACFKFEHFVRFMIYENQIKPLRESARPHVITEAEETN